MSSKSSIFQIAQLLLVTEFSLKTGFTKLCAQTLYSDYKIHKIQSPS